MSDPDADAGAAGPFLLDVMLGKLAVYLRMCGHDTAYALDRGVEADDSVLAWAVAEERTLVTRDEQLAGRASPAILLRERAVDNQVRELDAAGVSLVPDEHPSRCGACNGRLEAVPPEAATPDYAPDPAGRNVWRCRDCGQCFWKGSHWERVEAVLDSL